jgi:hypothetical protein
MYSLSLQLLFCSTAFGDGDWRTLKNEKKNKSENPHKKQNPKNREKKQ